MTKVFVIGPTGYIGRYTVQALQKAGHEVIGLSGSNKTLIFMSGSNVYGGCGDEPVDEMVEPEPGPMHEYEKLILGGGQGP